MNHPRTGALFLLLTMLVAVACTLPIGGLLSDAGTQDSTSSTGSSVDPNDASTDTGSVDTTPPTVTATSPTNEALNVAATAEVRVTFSEALDPATVTGATFTVTRGGAPIAGAVTYAGTTATFAPSSALALDGSFLVTVSTGVTDLEGNALATAFSWTFTTPNRPTVIATSPVDGDQGVALDRPVQATFSVGMDPATITAATFLVKQGATALPGVVTYAGTTATFAPTSDYPLATTLTATITTGAKDLSGNAPGQARVWTFKTAAMASQAPIALGLASSFAVLAFDKVANTASVGTVVTGDIGISPGNSLTGFPPGVHVGGKYTGIAAAPAQAYLLVAYDDAVGRQGAASLPADLAGMTFFPGLYRQVSAVALSAGTCTLDAQGDPNAVFIFQIGTAFSLAASTQIILSGGAKATNVYWAVGVSATLGATAKLQGTILAMTAITLGAGASVEGRLLAHGASVTLDTNVITVPAP